MPANPEGLHDLTAHLQGGIPDRDINALAPYWQVFPSMRDALFAPVRAGYSKAQIDAGKIKTTLLEYPEFKEFAQRAMTLLTQWQLNRWPCRNSALAITRKH